MHGKLLDFRNWDGVLGEDRSLGVQLAFKGQKLKSSDHTLRGSVRLYELRHTGNQLQNLGGVSKHGLGFRVWGGPTWIPK